VIFFFLEMVKIDGAMSLGIRVTCEKDFVPSVLHELLSNFWSTQDNLDSPGI
jgi:hypothetical protein